MKHLKATAALILIMACAVAQGQATNDPFGSGAGKIEVLRNGSRAATDSGSERYVGKARVEASFSRTDPARVAGTVVSFEPGAHTDWHSHPLGQTLFVTAGVGLTQCGNSPVVEMRPGDMIWCPPNVKHWHGGTPTTAVTHLAIYERLNGKSVDWGPKLTPAEYPGPKPQ